LRGKVVDWFARFGTSQLIATWDEVKVFTSRFNEVQNEGQVVVALCYAK